MNANLNKHTTERNLNMAGIAKKSVRIELNHHEYGDDTQLLIEDTFYEALDSLMPKEGDDDFLTSYFFSMRFDHLNNGGMAATVTASDKKKKN